MLKCEELRSKTSCLNKAEANEPIFVLRAKDPLAAQTIRQWAAMARGVHENEKIAEASTFADLMEEWGKQNRCFVEAPAEPPTLEATPRRDR